MKRKITSILAIALATILCFAVVGCNKGGGGGGGDEPLRKPVEETATHYVEGTLHNVSLTPNTSRVFAENNATAYKILLPASPTANEIAAAEYIADHVMRAMRVELPIVREDSGTFTANDKVLAVGNCALFDAAGLHMPTADLGIRGGVYIVSKDNAMFIRSNTAIGVETSAQMFLHHIFGMEIYTNDVIEYAVKAGDKVTLPDAEIVERPDFDYITDKKLCKDERRASTGDMFIPTDKTQALNDDYHNSFWYYNKATRDAHPGWVAEDGYQLCYSAHGVTEGEHSLDSMIDHGVNEMKRYVRNCTTSNNFSFTHEDTETWCSCSACTAEYVKYGTNSAVLIHFVNKMAERINAWLVDQFEAGEAFATENGKARQVRIFFFGYTSTVKPPVKRNASGAWEPIDQTVKCRPDVGVIVALIKATYTHTLYESINQSTFDNVTGWGAVADMMTTWLYDTNFRGYLYPYNSYEQAVESFRLCKSLGSVGMFNQGIWNDNNRTHFSHWKAYRTVNMAWDVNQDFESLRKKFFTAVYRDGAPAMDKMYTELLAHLNWIEETFDEVNGGLYEDIELAKYWPKGVLDRWYGYCQEAFAAIEKYKEIDYTLYETLERNLRVESMFPRFARIRLYGSYFAAEDLAEMKADFKTDAVDLGFYKFREFVLLDTITSDW